MNSDTNLYPLQKSFGWFYCTEFFQMEKRGTKNRHCQLSIFKENTEAHNNLQYFHLFFPLRFVGFWLLFFYPSFFSMFFWTSLVNFLHRTSLVYFCTIVWVIHTLFSIYLGFDIFSSTEKLRWQWRPRRRQLQCRVR